MSTGDQEQNILHCARHRLYISRPTYQSWISAAGPTEVYLAYRHRTVQGLERARFVAPINRFSGYPYHIVASEHQRTINTPNS